MRLKGIYNCINRLFLWFVTMAATDVERASLAVITVRGSRAGSALIGKNHVVVMEEDLLSVGEGSDNKEQAVFLHLDNSIRIAV